MLNEKKKGGWPYAKKNFQLVAFLLHLTVSLSQRSFETLFQHVKHCMTIFLSMKSATCNFTANSNTHVYKFGWTKLIFWYSHCPDLFVYTSSSLAFFLMQWVKSTVIFPSRPCFNFLCGQELFQQFLRDLSAKGIRLSVVEFNRKYMKLTKFVCDLRA